VTSSYWNSFLKERGIAVTTCRAGNVIGGGDFAADRIIPDCIRAAQSGADIVVRNPFSVRPYQHVLEPVVAYLMIAQAQYEDPSLSGSYNIGPNETDCWTTGELVDLFCREWKKQMGNDMKWINQYDGGPHEAVFLKLDCAKLKRTFGWQPVWNVETAMAKIVEWSNAYFRNENVAACMERQIEEYLDF
jgi:CDP-glucose 4,6-dehydratase